MPDLTRILSAKGPLTLASLPRGFVPPVKTRWKTRPAIITTNMTMITTTTMMITPIRKMMMPGLRCCRRYNCAGARCAICWLRAAF